MQSSVHVYTMERLRHRRACNIISRAWSLYTAATFVFFFSYQFTSSCPVFLSVRLRLVKKICRTLSSVSLLCVAGRMSTEAGPLTPGEDVLVHEIGDHARIVRKTRNLQELRCEGKRIENQ